MSQTIGIIGVGSMGGALASGLLNKPEGDGLKVKLFDIHRERISRYADDSRVELCDDLSGFKNADLIVLAVKPHDRESLCGNLSTYLGSQASVVSIMAGVTLEQLQTSLGSFSKVMRAMPNIAATVGASATAISASSACDSVQRAAAEFVFETVGEVVWIKEDLMDAVTGLSGSGPAYVYLCIEALIDGGVKMGIPRQLATRLATQTVLGAAKVVGESNCHPAELRDQVTTPGGTTIHALYELESKGIRAILMDAVATGTRRSQELGKS